MSHQTEKTGVVLEHEPLNSPSESVNLLDYLELLVCNKWLISAVTLLAAVVSVVVSLKLPVAYTSTAKIMPPQQGPGIMGLMMGQNNGMASLAGDLLGKGTPADQYVGMLNSEEISDAVIDRFKLMEVYDQKFRVDTQKVLHDKVDIVAGKKDGIVSITVEDKDPRRAAQMANAFVDELDKLAVKLDVTDAGNDSAFLEGRLAKTRGDLARAEENLKLFQAKNQALDIPEQAKGTIKGVGDLEGQLAVEEVKMAGLRRSYADGSLEVKNQQAVIGGLRQQIAKFQGKRTGAIPGVGSVPELGQQYLRLMREFKTQESLLEFLTKQYEMTKLTKSKSAAGVQVVQRARVSDKKAKPSRMKIVLAGTGAGFIASLLIAFLRQYAARMTQAERHQWQKIKALALGRG